VLAIDFELIGFELARGNGPAKIRARAWAGSTIPFARHHPDVRIASASVRQLLSTVGRCTGPFAAAQTARDGCDNFRR
jgi:hypothetical protein